MTRILGLQNKYPELGRIRIGEKTDDPRRPMKAIDTFRFTSDNEERIKAIAKIYGGTAYPWSEKPDHWEVKTRAEVLNVEIPGDAVFAAYEKWGQGGNQRRCNGDECVIPVEDNQGGHLETEPCVCKARNWDPGDPKDVKRGACSVKCRLKVLLPDVPGIGMWMLTTGSIYAAMELPAQIDLLDTLRRSLDYNIKCQLELQFRTEKRANEKYERRYRVPTLIIDDTMQEIKEAIAKIEAKRGLSVLPAREVAQQTPTVAPASSAGLAQGGGEPPRGSGNGHLARRPRGGQQ